MGDFSTIAFLLRTEAKPVDFSLQIGNNVVKPKLYQTSMSTNKNHDKYHYYYFSHKIEIVQDQEIEIGFLDLKKDFLVKDLIMRK